MVSELQCHEPGCPEVESVIAILQPGADRRKLTFDCAIDQLDRDMVEAAFRQ